MSDLEFLLANGWEHLPGDWFAHPKCGDTWFSLQSAVEMTKLWLKEAGDAAN